MNKSKRVIMRGDFEIRVPARNRKVAERKTVAILMYILRTYNTQLDLDVKYSEPEIIERPN